VASQEVSPKSFLRSYGVPVEWLDDVKKATEDSLFDVADHLPQEAAEALLDLATGTTPQVAVAAAKDTDPFSHPDAQRHFRAVVVMACDDEILPLQERIESVTDDSDLEEVYNTERHLLYVACTRARDHLLVTGLTPASEFLDDLIIKT